MRSCLINRTEMRENLNLLPQAMGSGVVLSSKGQVEDRSLPKFVAKASDHLLALESDFDASNDVKINPWLSESFQENFWFPRTYSRASGNSLVHASSEPVLYSRRAYERHLNSRPLVSSHDTSSIYTQLGNGTSLPFKHRPLTPWINERHQLSNGYGYGIPRKGQLDSLGAWDGTHDHGISRSVEYTSFVSKAPLLKPSQSLQNLAMLAPSNERPETAVLHSNAQPLPTVRGTSALRRTSLNVMESEPAQEKNDSSLCTISAGLPHLVDLHRHYLNPALREGEKRKNSWINEITSHDSIDKQRDLDDSLQKVVRPPSVRPIGRKSSQELLQILEKQMAEGTPNLSSNSAYDENDTSANSLIPGLTALKEVSGVELKQEKNARNTKNVRTRRKINVGRAEKVPETQHGKPRFISSPNKKSRIREEQLRKPENEKGLPFVSTEKERSMTAASTVEPGYENASNKPLGHDYSLLIRRRNHSTRKPHAVTSLNIRNRGIPRPLQTYCHPFCGSDSSVITSRMEENKKLEEDALKYKSGRSSIYTSQNKDSEPLKVLQGQSTTNFRASSAHSVAPGNTHVRIEHPEKYTNLIAGKDVEVARKGDLKSSLRRSSLQKKKTVRFDMQERTIYVYTPVQAH